MGSTFVLLMMALLQPGSFRGKHVTVFLDDRSAGVGAALDEAVEVVERVFGIDIDPFAFTWTDRDIVRVDIRPEKKFKEAGAKWVLHWPQACPVDNDDFLCHEVAHIIFLYAVEKQAGAKLRGASERKGMSAYGSLLDDWIDEAVAALGEGGAEETYSFGLKEAFEEDRLIPLPKFFAMKHPGHAAMLRREAWSSEAMIFYSQGWGFMHFLLESYGEGFTKHMTKTLMKGGDVRDALAWLGGHKSELKDPSAQPVKSIEALERAWRVWVEKRYP